MQIQDAEGRQGTERVGNLYASVRHKYILPHPSSQGPRNILASPLTYRSSHYKKVRYLWRRPHGGPAVHAGVLGLGKGRGNAGHRVDGAQPQEPLYEGACKTAYKPGLFLVQNLQRDHLIFSISVSERISTDLFHEAHSARSCACHSGPSCQATSTRYAGEHQA
jgi:hypothetical protein